MTGARSQPDCWRPCCCFFPSSDKAIFTATYELPAGTSIERTLEVVEAVDRFIDAELRAGAGEAAEGITNWATFETTQYREGETGIPVTLRSTLASRTDVTKLDSLNVYAQATGAAVPLLQVAAAAVVWEPSTIRRRGRLKTVTVSSELAPGVVASDVVARLRPWLDAGQPSVNSIRRRVRSVSQRYSSSLQRPWRGSVSLRIASSASCDVMTVAGRAMATTITQVPAGPAP